MKFNLLPAVTAVLGLSAMASHADTLLLSDNFNVTSYSGQPTDATSATAAANNNLANRQSGLYAGSSWTYAGAASSYNVQTGNTITALYPGPTLLSDGNYLLMSSAGVQNVLPINYDLAGNHAISISFDLYAPANSTRWGALTLSNTLSNGSDNAAFPTASQFGFLAEANGTVQEFNANGTPYLNAVESAVTGYPSSTWTVVLSDVVDGAAGTGSPFGGNGTYVALYYGDTLINGNALTTQFGDQTLYLGLYGLSNGAGFDNLSITAVPEPASVGYLVAAGMSFLILVARRRRDARG